MNKMAKNYEFGGPVGAFFMIIGLPFAVVTLNLMCNEVTIIFIDNSHT